MESTLQPLGVVPFRDTSPIAADAAKKSAQSFRDDHIRNSAVPEGCTWTTATPLVVGILNDLFQGVKTNVSIQLMNALDYISTDDAGQKQIRRDATRRWAARLSAPAFSVGLIRMGTALLKTSANPCQKAFGALLCRRDMAFLP